MQTTDNSNMIHHLNIDDKEVILLGTAHVSKESSQLVTSVIAREKPDTVCVELCESRYRSIQQKESWQDMDIVKVIREKKSFLLLSNLILASFQKRIAKKFDIKAGEEMIQAIKTAESTGAAIYLADRDIRTTLSRIWRIMGLWSKLKLLLQMVLSLGSVDDISEEDIEKMKQEDVLETVLSDIGKSLPELKDILINERDRYLAHKIRMAPGRKIVAVVGAGHVPGIKRYWNVNIDIDELEHLPPQKKISILYKWIIPVAISALIVYGFYDSGSHAGVQMITWWVAANALLAGLGALIAIAHPLTILSSIICAPLTSLNPMIAAGWVAGLVEVFFRKPKVKDLENLSEDILSIKGFRKNNVTRILLVVAFTNLGSTLGTLVAIPLMLKAFT